MRQRFGFNGLVDELRAQNARKVDMVVDSNKVGMTETGAIQIWENTESRRFGMTPETTLTPNEMFHSDLATKLDIPKRYYDRLREEHPDLLAGDVSTILSREANRRFLVRTFDGNGGTARCLLSANFKIIDHLDVLTATLSGLNEAGVKAEVSEAEITDRKLHVKFTSTEIQRRVPELLRLYAPRGREDYHGDDGIRAGFYLLNSETGDGMFKLVPRIMVLVCTNGLTRSVDAFQQAHLGGKMDEGVIRYSADTRHKNIELIAAQARDAVRTFMSYDYLDKVIDDMKKAHGFDMGASPIEKATTILANTQLFTNEEQDAILNRFVSDGDISGLGLVHAVTRNAHFAETADRAAEVEFAGERVMAMVTA